MEITRKFDSSDIFYPVTQVTSSQHVHHSHMGSRVTFGGVYGGRRPWAELLLLGPLGRLSLAGPTYLVSFGAMPTEPDVRDFLWQ